MKLRCEAARVFVLVGGRAWHSAKRSNHAVRACIISFDSGGRFDARPLVVEVSQELGEQTDIELSALHIKLHQSSGEPPSSSSSSSSSKSRRGMSGGISKSDPSSSSLMSSSSTASFRSSAVCFENCVSVGCG